MNHKNLEPEVVHNFVTYSPAGASIRTFVHLSQLFINGGKFTKFDFGSSDKNQEVYGSSQPPEYNLTKVTVPTILYCGDHDGFASVKDTQILASKLQNVVANNVIQGFSHIDFGLHRDLGQFVYSDILKHLQETN
jgi:pimeloyl-ACP methyl ester carboxylesterase